MIVETVAAYRLRPEKPRNNKQNRLSNAVPLITLMDFPMPSRELFERKL